MNDLAEKVKPTDQYDFWRRRMAGEVVPIHDGEPQAGFYRTKTKDGRGIPSLTGSVVTAYCAAASLIEMSMSRRQPSAGRTSPRTRSRTKSIRPRSLANRGRISMKARTVTAPIQTAPRLTTLSTVSRTGLRIWPATPRS
jgi:hypothetical protein